MNQYYKIMQVDKQFKYDVLNNMVIIHYIV